MIDSHCHLHMMNPNEYGLTNLDEIIEQCFNNGIEEMLCVATELTQAKELHDIASKYPKIKTSIGLHPTDSAISEPTMEEIVNLSNHKHVVAIGETGLDYYRDNSNDVKSLQKQRFENHINAGLTLNKPLIIHTRSAKFDTLDILRSEKAYETGGVFHCFTEDLDMAKKGLDLNFYISFSGIITFKNAADLREVVRYLPLDSILIETDAPFLAPVPFRGKPNIPYYVKHVAEEVAKIKQVTYDEVIKVTTDNYYKLFNRA